MRRVYREASRRRTDWHRSTGGPQADGGRRRWRCCAAEAVDLAIRRHRSRKGHALREEVRRPGDLPAASDTGRESGARKRRRGARPACAGSRAGAGGCAAAPGGHAEHAAERSAHVGGVGEAGQWAARAELAGGHGDDGSLQLPQVRAQQDADPVAERHGTSRPSDRPARAARSPAGVGLGPALRRARSSLRTRGWMTLGTACLGDRPSAAAWPRIPGPRARRRRAGRRARRRARAHRWRGRARRGRRAGARRRRSAGSKTRTCSTPRASRAALDVVEHW